MPFSNLDMYVKQFLKNMSHIIGYDIRRIDTPTRSIGRGLAVLSKHIAPRSIIDIGVADGTPELYKCFPASRHRYLLIEADPAYGKSVEKLAGELGGIAEKVYCGRKSGTIKMNISPSYGRSSGYLSSSYSKPADVIDVPVRPLDGLVKRNALAAPYFVKIDVEGAELDVILGASEVLRQTEALLIETSIASRFEGAPEFSDIVSVMSDRGFSVFDILAAANNREGKLSQADLLFVRTSASFR